MGCGASASGAAGAPHPSAWAPGARYDPGLPDVEAEASSADGARLKVHRPTVPERPQERQSKRPYRRPLRSAREEMETAVEEMEAVEVSSVRKKCTGSKERQRSKSSDSCSSSSSCSSASSGSSCLSKPFENDSSSCLERSSRLSSCPNSSSPSNVLCSDRTGSCQRVTGATAGASAALSIASGRRRVPPGTRVPPIGLTEASHSPSREEVLRAVLLPNAPDSDDESSCSSAPGAPSSASSSIQEEPLRAPRLLHQALCFGQADLDRSTTIQVSAMAKTMGCFIGHDLRQAEAALEALAASAAGDRIPHPLTGDILQNVSEFDSSHLPCDELRHVSRQEDDSRSCLDDVMTNELQRFLQGLASSKPAMAIPQSLPRTPLPEQAEQAEQPEQAEQAEQPEQARKTVLRPLPPVPVRLAPSISVATGVRLPAALEPQLATGIRLPAVPQSFVPARSPMAPPPAKVVQQPVICMSESSFGISVKTGPRVLQSRLRRLQHLPAPPFPEILA